MLRLISRLQWMLLWQSWALHQQQASLGRQSQRRLWIRYRNKLNSDLSASMIHATSAKDVQWLALPDDATRSTMPVLIHLLYAYLQVCILLRHYLLHNVLAFHDARLQRLHRPSLADTRRLMLSILQSTCIRHACCPIAAWQHGCAAWQMRER